jgi:hypothetical protein
VWDNSITQSLYPEDTKSRSRFANEKYALDVSREEYQEYALRT